MSHVTLTALPPTATHLRIISKNARRSSRCSSMVCWCGIHFSRCQCHIWRGCRRLIIFLRCCVSMLVGKGVRCADGTPAYGLDVPGPGTGLGGAQHIMCLDEGCCRSFSLPLGPDALLIEEVPVPALPCVVCAGPAIMAFASCTRGECLGRLQRLRDTS